MTACFLSHCFAFIFGYLPCDWWWWWYVICPPLIIIYRICCTSCVYMLFVVLWWESVCDCVVAASLSITPKWFPVGDIYLIVLSVDCCPYVVNETVTVYPFPLSPYPPHFMLSVLECYLWSPRRIKNDWGFGGFFNCYIARLFHLLLAQRVFLLLLQCELFLSAFVLWYGTRIGAALLWLYLVICFVIYVLLFVWWIGPIMPGSRLLTLCFGLFALSLNIVFWCSFCFVFPLSFAPFFLLALCTLFGPFLPGFVT